MRLYDKCRGPNYAIDIIKHYAIDIIKYTHYSSFLPHGTKINISTSQFHRITRLVTDKIAFQREIAIMLVKLIVKKCMPRKPLLSKLRKLLYHGDTRYRHGTPVHRPGFHHRRILFWLKYGEERGVEALVQLTTAST